MMINEPETVAIVPKVFISYAWGSDEYNERVRELADRLMSNGVDIIIDQYDLEIGADKNRYMERIVLDTDIQRVLILCNKKYKIKADAREGGVGIESTIMSKEVYERAKNKSGKHKFIPIVFELDEDEHSVIPIMLEANVYINLSTVELENENFELLIRAIFEKPVKKKPPVGERPNYLLEDTTSSPSTVGLQSMINTFIRKGDYKAIDTHLRDFRAKFLLGYEEIGSIYDEKTNLPSHEVAWQKCTEFSKLVCEFIDTISIIIDSKLDLLDNEFAHSLIEEMLSKKYTIIKSGSSSYYDYDAGHIDWIITFTLTMFTSIFIKRGLFKQAYYLIKTPYLCQLRRIDDHDYHPLQYVVSTNHRIFDEIMKNKLSNRKHSNSAQLISESVSSKSTTLADYIDADLYICIVPKREAEYERVWIPYSLIYSERSPRGHVSIFKRFKKLQNLLLFAEPLYSVKFDANTIRNRLFTRSEFERVSLVLLQMMLFTTLETAIYMQEWGVIE